MIGRIVFVVAINVAFLVGVIFLLPIQGLLQVRGYSQAQIAALTSPQGPTADTTGIAQPTQAPNPGAQAGTMTPATAKPDKQAATQKPPKPVHLVATSVINVRSGPSTDHPAVGQIVNGSEVTVVSDPGNDWIRIKQGNIQGWAYRPLFKAK